MIIKIKSEFNIGDKVFWTPYYPETKKKQYIVKDILVHGNIECISFEYIISDNKSEVKYAFEDELILCSQKNKNNLTITD